MMLAAALLAMCASSALAQSANHKITPGVTHRATYASQGATPVRYVGARHLEETVEGGGCASCGAPASSCTAGCTAGCSSGGCNGGCNNCRTHCPCPPLLPNVVDNVADLFVRFKPCPGPCSPCRRTVHCCPYPKTMPPTNRCCARLPGILDTIFFCKGHGGCGCGGGGCASGGCNGCSSCAQSGMMMAPEELTPPSPPPMMKSNPFPDDPETKGAKRPATGTKTAGTPKNWYKTRSTATITDNAPETIVIGNATPIRIRE
jgi:hypothetical protein